MAKKKGELPSGSIRRRVYDHSEPVLDSSGKPVIDPKTGKPKKKRIYISVTASSAREADQERARIKADKQSYSKPAAMTLYEAIDKYIQSVDALLSPSTLAGYRKIQRNAFPGIMHQQLASITNDTLRQAVNDEAKRPKKKKGSGTISAKTVVVEYELIQTVIKLYAKNIDTTVHLPQVATPKHDLSTPDVIFNMVKGTDTELAVLLAMWLSFSASEVIGLTKSKSISTDGLYITVAEVIVMDEHNQPVVKAQGKQPKRNRTLRLPAYIKDLIDKVDGDRLIPMSGAALSKRFARQVKKAGIPHMTFHDLRHVSASVMTQLHVPDKYAQDRGGWHSDNIMKSVYQQTFAPERVAVDDKIDEYFAEVTSGEKMPPKYKFYLGLFDLDDSEECRENFRKFCADNKIKL